MRQWPEARQEEIAELLLALDGDAGDLAADGAVPAMEADLDAAIAEADRGDYADPKAVEAFFAQHRR